MKILVVSQYFPPEAVPIPFDVAQELSARGHAVRVLTGFPNYPSGEIFAGYRQGWRRREQIGKISVLRVPLYADHSQRLLRRVFNYLSFAASSASARRFSRGADAVYVYATQTTAAFGPWLWRMTGGPPYILHIQDLWPDTVVGSDVAGAGRGARWMARLLSPWIRSVYRNAAAVVGIAPTMVETLKQRVPSARVSLVYNWAEETGARREDGVRGAQGRGAVVIYAGNVGEMQDLETVLRAAHSSADAGVQLLIVGDGVARPRLERLSEDLDCTNVRFEDPVSRDQVASLYARADFGLVSLRDLRVFRGTIPSKLQSILANGLPVVATAQGDVRFFVEQHRVGLTADAEDVAALADAFRRAALMTEDEKREMGGRAEAAYRDNFHRESGLSRLESVLSAAAQRNQEKQ